MDLIKIKSFYASKIEELKEVLEKKRLSLGEADSAKESRFPTGRVELEDEIKLIENKIQNTKVLLNKLKQIENNTKHNNKVANGTLVTFTLGDEQLEYFFVEGSGDLDQGLLSLDSPLGAALKNMTKGEKKSYNDSEVEILEIK